MGCSTQIACTECKQNYWLGYGSYSSYSSREMKFPFEKHNEHHLVGHFEDYTFESDGHLWAEGGYSDSTILIENFSQFEEIDAEDKPPIYVRWHEKYFATKIRS